MKWTMVGDLGDVRCAVKSRDLIVRGVIKRFTNLRFDSCWFGKLRNNLKTAWQFRRKRKYLLLLA